MSTSVEEKPAYNIFSNAETKLVIIVMKHLQGTPEVDWEVVAQEYGYKDGAMARKKFREAKTKCGKAENSSTDGTSVPTPKTPKSTKRGKAKDVDPNETPSKRPRKTPTPKTPKSKAKAKSKATEEEAEDQVKDEVKDEVKEEVKEEVKKEEDSENETVLNGGNQSVDGFEAA